MLPNLNLITKISTFTGFSLEEISLIVEKYHRKYKRYTIPKINGGQRQILHPAKELKSLQYAIYESLLRQQPVHDLATAYIPQLKSPLRTTATKHSKFRYTIRIDFHDFFHSIQPNDLIRCLTQRYTVDRDEISILTKSLFFFVKRNNAYILPIGAPTSPAISNIIMYDLDDNISRLAKRIDPDSTITRYADDVHFSTNTKGKCLDLHNELNILLSSTPSPMLKINIDKTLYLSRGTRRIITGLVITPDGLVSLGRKRKAQIKSLIYRHSKGPLSKTDFAKAKGLLAFARDCEPSYLDKLAIKYGDPYYSIMRG